jgi:hypothetical protein
VNDFLDHVLTVKDVLVVTAGVITYQILKAFWSVFTIGAHENPRKTWPPREGS